MTILLPLPQDALNNAVRWNAEWERLLSGPYALPDGPSRCFDEALRDMGDVKSVEISLDNYPSLFSSTCAIQRNLTHEALSHFSRNDFERKWMRASSDVRAQHILGAMGAVCSKARNLHDARAYCPEIRLLRLKLDGKVFLNLLKSLMLEDASFIPSEYKSVPNKSWDTWAAKQREKNESEEEKLALADILLLRAKLISHVVHFTMRSFFGEEPPDITVQRAIHKPKFSSEPPPELVASLGYDAAKTRMKEDIAGIKDRHRQRPDICSYLGCVKSAPDPSVRFSRCPTCFDDMDRSVRYCSQACQRADWEGGHREVCGRAIDYDSVSEVAEHPTHGPSSRPHISLPVDGFKRTIALVHQITQLNLNPTVDYFLYNSSKKEVPFTFPANACCQYLFRHHRELAMTTGASEQVAHMAHLLSLMFASDRALAEDDKKGVTPDIIVEQMSREYEVEDLSLRKLAEAAQELQDEDKLHRPVSFRNVPLELWEYDDKLFNLSGTRVTFKPAVGPPVDGFTRSPELTEQVNNLIDWPGADYFFINKDKENIQWDYGAGTYLQKAFRAVREAAMTTGSTQHVATMAHFLCISFSGRDTQNETGVSPKTIVAQMGREFRMNNVREMVLQAQRDQQADPLRRPPLFWDAPLDVWEAENQQRHWAHLVVTFD